MISSARNSARNDRTYLHPGNSIVANNAMRYANFKINITKSFTVPSYPC